MYWVRFSTVNKIEFVVSQSGTSATTLVSDSTYQQDQWYHITVTYTYVTPSSSEMRVYVDGQLVKSTDYAVGPLEINNKPLIVGIKNNLESTSVMS